MGCAHLGDGQLVRLPDGGGLGLCARDPRLERRGVQSFLLETLERLRPFATLIVERLLDRRCLLIELRELAAQGHHSARRGVASHAVHAHDVDPRGPGRVLVIVGLGPIIASVDHRL